MKRNIFVFMFVVLALFLGFGFMMGCGTGGGGSAPQPFVADIYVSTTGSDESGDGSLDNPYKTVEKALGMVSPEGTIGVFDGIYKEDEIDWPDTANITLKGASKTGTIIDGDSNTKKLFRIWGVSSVGIITIESMTIRDSYVDGFGGAIFHNLDIPLHLKNVILSGNIGTQKGGAVHVSSGSLVAQNCTFSNNKCTKTGTNFGGGAIYVGASEVFIATDCVFENNSASPESGGAVYNLGTINLKRCSINGNTAFVDGGGIANIGTTSQGRVENCLIYNNEAGGNGAGIFDASTLTLEVVNCDIVSNEAGFNGGGVWAGNETWVRNCIIWGNLAGNAEPQLGTCATPYLDYSDVQDLAGLSAGVVFGPGTIEAYPNFAGLPPSNDDDLRLNSPPSEVAQGGTTDNAPDDDFDGNPRGGSYSMGAFEY